MKYLLAAFSAVAIEFTAATAHAQQALPADAARFVKRRELCDHFRGEEPYNAERGAFLAAQLDKYCKGTDRELAALKQKYKAQRSVMTKLNEFEASIEAP